VKELPYTSDADAILTERIVQRIQREVDQINETLDRTEQVKKIVLLSEPWTVENGDLSQTLKLKRKFLLEKHKEIIDAIYAES
jgi:long-chain acyl-CoA synthetase